jgi:hypothetical protein
MRWATAMVLINTVGLVPISYFVRRRPRDWSGADGTFESIQQPGRANPGGSALAARFQARFAVPNPSGGLVRAVRAGWPGRKVFSQTAMGRN